MCNCVVWERTEHPYGLITEHHPDCPDFNLEGDVKRHINRLIDSMIDWGNQEDGIPEEYFDALMHAAAFIGRNIKQKQG